MMIGTKNKKKTMFDTVATGMYQTGDVAQQVCADKSGPKHVLIQGMTGSGKTDGEKPVILACAARGANHVILDVRKKTQSYGMLAPVLNWLVVDDGLARAALARLIDHVIPARTAALADAGFSSWHPDSPLRFMRFQVEEAWDFADEDTLTETSLAARSAGIQLIMSVQRASHDLINTSLRDQLGTVKCYGLKNGWGASVLSDDVEDAGAHPHQWADEHPGMHYMEQGKLTIAQKITPIRAYTDMGTAKFADAAKKIAADGLVQPFDDVTEAAWGEIFAKARKPMDLMARIPVRGASSTSPTPPAPPVSPAPPTGGMAMGITNDDTNTDEDEDDVDETVLHPIPSDPTEIMDEGRTVRFAGARNGELMHLSEPDPDPDFIPDPDAEIDERPEDREEVVLGDGPGEKVDREGFEQAMEKQLAALLAEPKDLITAAMFADVVIETGWSRATVYRTIDTWTDAGRLARVDHGWIPVRT